MVKKVGGKPPGRTPETAPVQPTKTVGGAKVGGVGQVKGTEKQSATGRAGEAAGPITADQREQLYQLIEEEADKLFGKDGLPAKKKATIKGAVRMVIDGSIVEDEEESSSS